MDNPLYPGVNVPNKIIVHHTAYAPRVPQYALVNQWHKDRDFPLSELGSYVGYQYLIEFDGSVTQCRKETEGGAHTIGENWQSVGICLAGDFSQEQPTEQQAQALTKLMEGVIERNNIAPDQVFPHRHFNDTTCYGTLLSDEWAKEQLGNLIPALNQELEMCFNSTK